MANYSGQQHQSNQSSGMQAQASVHKPEAPKKPTSTRGFAAMDAEKHKRVSAQGGRASQQQQQGARQAKTDHAQTQTSEKRNTVAGNFSDKNKQESSTESASSSRSGSNQSTGLGGPAQSFPSDEWDQNRAQQSGVDKDR